MHKCCIFQPLKEIYFINIKQMNEFIITITYTLYCVTIHPDFSLVVSDKDVLNIILNIMIMTYLTTFSFCCPIHRWKI